MSDWAQQLKEYRESRSWDYHKAERLENIKRKYASLLVLNNDLRAAYRIVGFVKRSPRFSYVFINEDKEKFLFNTPGRFRYRTFYQGGLYVYDLREIGPLCKKNRRTPEQVMMLYPPLEPYKVEHVYKQWVRVDPTTSSGVMFKQNMAHQRVLIEDRKKEFRNV